VKRQRPRRKRADSLLLPQTGASNPLRVTMAAHLEWLLVRNYSAATVRSRGDSLSLFAHWCEARSLGKPEEVTKPILERYQRHLFLYRKKDGRPLGAGTQHGRLLAVKGYFRWMARQNFLLSNPASELELPRKGHHLPYFVLTPQETDTILSQPDLSTLEGLRDRAILETLYSTGMRRMEVVGLTVFSIRPESGTVFIAQGKGRKDRVVPIGERALAWVEKYSQEARPKLVMEPDPGVLFLTELGEPFHPNRLTHIVREYVRKAGVSPRGACHLFRHVMATQMLENGADVRYLQALLGHASLESTQVYTQVSIRKLKEIHTATHPAARLEKSSASAEAPEAGEAREQLLSSLAAEAAEEEAPLP
jgi:integrase/recombinase XerD